MSAPRFQADDRVMTVDGPGYIRDAFDQAREGYPSDWCYCVLLDDGGQAFLPEDGVWGL